MIREKRFMMIALTLVSYLLILLISKGICEELQLPPMPPSIEELTQGKVKIGDVITKDNMELVKDYLPLGVHECVKNGMVLKMATNLPAEKINPTHYLEATERNAGQAVIDDHGVVRLKDGSPWPGGIPFIEPKTGFEVMGYVRFAHAFDDCEALQQVYYVNKRGKCYKTGAMRIFNYLCDARVKVPPLGQIPGQEDYHERFINVFTYPLELKGLGQFSIKYIDDTEHYDIGFAYLPAFKRTIRISATTYQDNVGGSDMTFGDPEGLREPFGTWNFKLIGKKYMLVTEPIKDRQARPKSDGIFIDTNIDWDQGMKYPRFGWTTNPVYVVEATPKDESHLYSKKIIYVNAPYFAQSVTNEVAMVDLFDSSGALWKAYYDYRGGSYIHEDGTRYTPSSGFGIHDLQSGHSTNMPVFVPRIDYGMEPEFLSLNRLLQLGR